jgi:hypothetical protein
MHRFLSERHFDRVINDFQFLFKTIRTSRGELDLRLRDGYFSLYYKGNSMAKVSIHEQAYLVEVHHKFMPEGFFRGDQRFHGRGPRRGGYRAFHLDASEMHPFFQKKYLDRLGGNIAQVNYGEEIAFEHLLITDNLERVEFFVLDRQVTERALRGRRMDLLAATQVDGDRYRFLVIEVKLGNNPELEDKVYGQLKRYVDHVEARFEEWKRSYELAYRQMKAFGLFGLPAHEAIEIVAGVNPLVCFGGYTGLAQKSIRSLKDKHPDITVSLFRNLIEVA